jgi:hypothetical protein
MESGNLGTPDSMSDKPTISLREAKALERERHLQQAATLEQELAELDQLEALAAKFNVDVVPKEPTIMPWEVKTLGALIQVYKTSDRYKALGHASRNHYGTLLGMIGSDHGTELLAQLGMENFESWHAKWSEGGKKSMGHAKIKMVRIVIGFGTEVLHDRECERLTGVLSTLKFEAPKARVEHLTRGQADLIRGAAHALMRPSIALAQAFQTEIGLLQKNVIGEWVPLEEGGVSDITSGPLKWVRGIRWSEIDANMILRHQSEGWRGYVEFDLRKAPMIVDELKRQFDFTIDRSPRFLLPASGPIIVSEFDKLPWTAPEFRRWWRQVANHCGIPKSIRNSDSRTRLSERGQEASDDETEARLAKN